MVDVDSHLNLEDALALARKSSIRVAVSNPCFELWMLWHYEDHSAHVTTKEIQRKLKLKIKDYDKELPPGFPYAECETAKKRATMREKGTHGVVSPNPGSTAWLVVDAIKQARSIDTKRKPTAEGQGRN